MRLVRFVSAFLTMAIAGLAQVDTGRIVGTILDATGATVPGASVSIINEGTGLRQTATTSNDGVFTFTPVRIGSYTVEAQATGFQKARRTGVVVNIQQQALVEFKLAPGDVTTTIDITDALPVLQTQNASIGETVAAKTIAALPLSSRNYNFLARLTAGVTHPQPEGRGLNATGWFAANGTRPAQNNFLLDGIDNNSNNVDFLSGAAYVLKPPVDAIGEFKIQTNSFSAEFGRAGGAVLNASLKSGTNDIRGALWEFLRNSKMDATDFFLNQRGVQKGAYKQNIFRAAVGGPIVRNRTFFFANFEGTRIRQAVPITASVPTALQRSSGYTNFSELITNQSGTRTDLDGRSFASGTIFDPSTTRNARDGRCCVRDPFPGNAIPGARVSPTAVKLMQLFPAPNGPGIFNNFNLTRGNTDDTNAFDFRIDHNFSERDQIFGRYSFADTVRFKPAPFEGVADGGGFNQGDETVRTQGAAISYTHTFSPTLVNEFRAGFNRENALRLQPFGNDTSNLPEQYGIPGVLQAAGNGGLPRLNIGGLSALGASDWIVSERFSNTYQLSNNLTKIYGNHTLKAGWEGQLIDFPWTAPPTARGNFGFNGTFASIPTSVDSSTGRAQFMLRPTDAAGVGGVGANSVNVSNFGSVGNRKYYTGFYVQDDWKIGNKLTLNLGLRWDMFSLVGEKYDAQANFIPSISNPEFIIPASRQDKPVISESFKGLLAKNGIKLTYSDEFGSGLGRAQKTNFAPRFGFAYRATNKFVVRGGFGMFYGAFENRGGYPNLGYNYPFQFAFAFGALNAWSPTQYADGQIATLDRGLLSVPLEPRLVNGRFLDLRGIQFDYQTPYTMGYNFTTQYEVMKNASLEVGYVASLSRHLENFIGSNRVSQLLPLTETAQNYIPWPDFAQGSSYAGALGNSHYHSMQSKFTKRFSTGLDFLASYTWAKTLTNAGDLLSGGDVSGYRAAWVPGFGAKREMGLASFHVGHAFTFSGSYEMPWGKGRRMGANMNPVANAILGGWSTNWILTLYGGQPVTIGCPQGTGAGTGCYAFLTGEEAYVKKVEQWWNPAAFRQPPAVQTRGQQDFSPLGGYRTPVLGPPFRKMDFSLFKDFNITERYRLQFRAESFNLTNTPAFANPSFRNFVDARNFGRITATRNNPNDARQVQLALKLYF